MPESPDQSIVIVVARADNGVIGRDGDIPWHISSDLKRFRRVTMGKPMIMGRKTYESIGKPLDGRDNIVVTRNPDFKADGILVAGSMDEALTLAREKAAERGADEITVIGGAEIYRLVLPMTDIIDVTEVHISPEGDTWFPELDDAEWREVSRERHEPGLKDSAPYSFVILERIPID